MKECWISKWCHYCDVFAENGAFIYKELSEYAKVVWDNKYPCGSGGWLNYRVTDNEQL